MTEANLSYVAKSFAANVVADIKQPRKRRFGYMRDWVRTNYRWLVYRPNLPSTSIYELCGESSPPRLDISYQYSSMTLPPMELYVLGMFCQWYKPKRIFEFGTYKGGTTLHLARSAPDALITTLDFDPNAADDGLVHYLEDTPYTRHFKPGQHFHGLPEQERITQVYGDSLKFDFTPYHDQFDLIFVDAEHEYVPGMSDSKNAFKMLKKAKGVIVWDDYSTWPGLKQALEELSAEYPIYHIKETRLAMMRIGH